jgi:probable HAF family extracellular repeat protein
VSINDSDQVTGSGDIHGFVYSAGTSTLFDAPNAVQTVPRSINKSGQVVGMYYDSSYVSHGFLYSGGTVTTIDIACPAVPPTTGVTDTDVWSINDSGQMAGYCTDALGLSHGFVQTGTAGTPTIFDVPGAASIGTVPRSINTSGQVAGWYTDSFGSTHGFVTSAIGGTVTPPATPSCTKPKGAKFTSGRGIVTEVGTNYVMVVNLRIDYASCTRMNYGVDAKAPAVHDRIEWEGYNETNGNVMSQTLSFN